MEQTLELAIAHSQRNYSPEVEETEVREEELAKSTVAAMGMVEEEGVIGKTQQEQVVERETGTLLEEETVVVMVLVVEEVVAVVEAMEMDKMKLEQVEVVEAMGMGKTKLEQVEVVEAVVDSTMESG